MTPDHRTTELEQDIAEAIGVGTMVRKGAADKMDGLAESQRRTAPSASRGSTRRCCA